MRLATAFERKRGQLVQGAVASGRYNAGMRSPVRTQSKVGSLPFTFFQFSERQFALRVDRIPNATGRLSDFFSIVIPFPSHNPHRANTHPIFEQMKPVRPAPVSQI